MIAAAIGRLCQAWAGRRPGGPRLAILSYHRVLPQLDPLRTDAVSSAAFAAQLDWLQRYLQPLDLAQGVDSLLNGRLQRDSFAVSFDDGYRDNFDHAAPLLAARGIPATFFVSTGYLNGGVMWNDKLTEMARQLPARPVSFSEIGIQDQPLHSLEDRRRLRLQLIRAVKYQPADAREALVDQWVRRFAIQLPAELMMDPSHLGRLAPLGVTLGAHTHSHPILKGLDADSAEREISAPSAILQANSGGAIRLFAYPNGRRDDDYAEREIELVRGAGFSAAVTTEYGAARRDSQRFELPRVSVWSQPLPSFARRMAGVLMRR